MGRSRKRELKPGDKVLYTIPGGRPQDVEYEWTITSMFPVVDGHIACLSRPDPEKKLKVDRCNAEVADLVRLK